MMKLRELSPYETWHLKLYYYYVTNRVPSTPNDFRFVPSLCGFCGGKYTEYDLRRPVRQLVSILSLYIYVCLFMNMNIDQTVELDN